MKKVPKILKKTKSKLTLAQRFEVVQAKTRMHERTGEAAKFESLRISLRRKCGPPRPSDHPDYRDLGEYGVWASDKLMKAIEEEIN